MKHKLFSFLLLLPTWIASQPSSDWGLYIWNVGQGSWATWVDQKDCLHFDMGGEFVDLERVHRMCKNKKNILYLSHWDYDHFSFVFSFYRKNKSLCLAQKPYLTADSSKSKKNLYVFLPLCKESDLKAHEVISLYSPKNTTETNRQNQLSLVYLHGKSSTLFPGDSPSSAEKYWNPHRRPQGLRLWLLGHHGSSTSSSENTFITAGKPKMAIASARKRRYGHPHPKIIKRMKKLNIPLLQTEKWGNLYFPYDAQ